MTKSFVEKLMKSGALPIHYIKCDDKEGRRCYFFLQASHQKMLALKKVPKDASINLEDYGTVVASGFGERVSQSVKDELLEKYDYDVDKLFPEERLKKDSEQH